MKRSKPLLAPPFERTHTRTASATLTWGGCFDHASLLPYKRRFHILASSEKTKKQNSSYKRRILMFPGQGSQHIGMGSDLVEEFKEARDVFNEVDEALAFPLSRLMKEGTPDELKMTENAQPALLAHSIAAFAVLKSQLGWENNTCASLLMGHSLGEFSALCAAGCLSVWDTARLVRARGVAMQRAVPLGKGSMAALMGVNIHKTAEEICKQVLSKDQGLVCEIANINSPRQVVLSGSAQGIEHALVVAKQMSNVKRAEKLVVSAPFHCSLMKPAAEELAQYIQANNYFIDVEDGNPSSSTSSKFALLAVPVVSNATATEMVSPRDIYELMIQQVTAPVLWYPSVMYASERIANMSDSAAPSQEEVQPGEGRRFEFVEIGAGKVLSSLTSQILSGKQGFVVKNVATAQDLMSYCRSYRENE